MQRFVLFVGLVLILSGCPCVIETEFSLDTSRVTLSEGQPSATVMLSESAARPFDWVAYSSDPRITVSPDAGAAGTELTITALDFEAYYTATVVIRSNCSKQKAERIWVTVGDPGEANIWTKTYPELLHYPGKRIIAHADGSSTVLAGKNLLKVDTEGNVVWQQIISDSEHLFVRDIAEVPGGGYIVGGADRNEAGEGVGYIARLDSSGTVVWDKTIADTNLIMSALVTSDNHYVLLTSDSQLLKFDPDGELQWHRTDILSAEPGYGDNPLIETSDGGFVLITNTSLSISPFTILVLRLDSEGNVLWRQSYYEELNDSLAPLPFFSGYEISGCTIQETNEGDLAVAATLEVFTFMGMQETTSAMLLMKVSGAGEMLWANAYKSIGSTKECSQALAVTDTGDFILAGENYEHLFWLGNPGFSMIIQSGLWDHCYGHLVLIKVDSDGNEIWNRMQPCDGVFGMDLAEDGGIMLTGGEGGQVVVFKTDAEGYGVFYE